MSVFQVTYTVITQKLPLYKRVWMSKTQIFIRYILPVTFFFYQKNFIKNLVQVRLTSEFERSKSPGLTLLQVVQEQFVRAKRLRFYFKNTQEDNFIVVECNNCMVQFEKNSRYEHLFKWRTQALALKQLHMTLNQDMNK